MRRVLTLTLALLAGCGQPVSVFWIDAREKPDFQTIVEACAWWGLDCEETDNDEGALTILVTDLGSGVAPDAEGKTIQGAIFDKQWCGPAIWGTDQPGVLEHEIGHAFGLKHRDDPGNIMHRSDPAIDLDVTDWQWNKVHRCADFLANCVGP